MNSFFDKISGENILDILSTGVVDIEDGIADFIPMANYIFFEFETKIIRFELIEESLELKLNYANLITYDFEVEEDMYPAKSSISNLILTSTLADNTVKSIEVYDGKQIENEISCCAISFLLCSGQELFLDPASCFGLNIGGKEQKDLWLNNYPNTESYTVPKSIIKLH